MQEERELLSRQQDAMREHAGPRELRMCLDISYVKEKRNVLLIEHHRLGKKKKKHPSSFLIKLLSV